MMPASETTAAVADAPPAADWLVADERSLAQALRERDGQAARAAYARFSPIVSRVLRRTLGPRFDVEDIQQDIFLAFFRNVPQLREAGALRSFLMSITSHTIKYQLRCARTRKLIRFWERNDDVPDPQIVAPDSDGRDTLVAFYSVLDSLNPRDRTLFGLRFLEGMDLASVAGTTGISLSTAKRHLTRIWKTLAKRVRKEPALASEHRSRGRAAGLPASAPPL